MLVRYTYPINTNLSVDESWPINVGPYRIEWSISDGRITELVIIVRVPKNLMDQLPRVTTNPTPGIAAGISVGTLPLSEETDQFLRTFRGVLGFFSQFEIELARRHISWMPENDEERSQLQLYSFTSAVQKVQYTAVRTPFDLIVRSAFSADELADFEVALSFLRKADRDLDEMRYIDAFYSLFFFLETLFAPGFSSPERVKRKFKEARPIQEALSKLQMPDNASGTDVAAYRSILSMGPDGIIDHLVTLRGNLHHHALSRKPQVWHPEEPERFRVDTLILHSIVHQIAFSRTMKCLYGPSMERQLMESAEQNNAVTTLEIHPVGLGPNGVRLYLNPMACRLPTTRPSTLAVLNADAEFRERMSELYPNQDIVSYEITSENGETIFAAYNVARQEKRR